MGGFEPHSLVLTFKFQADVKKTKNKKACWSWTPIARQRNQFSELRRVDRSIFYLVLYVAPATQTFNWDICPFSQIKFKSQMQQRTYYMHCQISAPFSVLLIECAYLWIELRNPQRNEIIHNLERNGVNLEGFFF